MKLENHKQLLLKYCKEELLLNIDVNSDIVISNINNNNIIYLYFDFKTIEINVLDLLLWVYNKSIDNQILIKYLNGL